MSIKQDRRQFTRVTIAIEAVVVPVEDGERMISGLTTDLSMKGIYVVCEDKLPAGTRCHVTLVPSGEEKHFRIEVNAQVVRVADDGMGIEFVEIMGLESYEHLRNVVMYNSSQEIGQVEEEFKKHLGIKERK
jgi:c-di-GMP-binding flagellar brake protein YcgR